MELFATLAPNEKTELLKFPAYISLLAANHDGTLDQKEKQSAIDLATIKDYEKHEPKLGRFYAEAAQTFKKDLEYLDLILPNDTDSRQAALLQQLSKLEPILAKLGTEYRGSLEDSLQSFKNKVSKAHENVLEHFIFPFPIKGFTDI